jgi:hypothetical protein
MLKLFENNFIHTINLVFKMLAVCSIRSNFNVCGHRTAQGGKRGDLFVFNDKRDPVCHNSGGQGARAERAPAASSEEAVKRDLL